MMMFANHARVKLSQVIFSYQKDTRKRLYIESRRSSHNNGLSNFHSCCSDISVSGILNAKTPYTNVHDWTHQVTRYRMYVL